MPRVLRIGHRGAAGHAPENTLAAIERGIVLGADFVEIDVRRTSDGVLVALHDSTIGRTTDGKGRVSGLSLHELRAFHAGNGERIPTVEEVLTTAAGRAGVMLELKVAGIADLIVQAVEKAAFPNRVIYASFLHDELPRIQATPPDAVLMALFDRLPRAGVNHAVACGAAYIGLRHNRISRRLVEAFHHENILVCVYTPNSREEIDRALSLGVDGVISDFPERITGH
jgi:glycerophosphoryl diester phosphodiesterase